MTHENGDIAIDCTGSKSLAVYIHWPFCLSKCPYCDFNSRVMGQVDQNDWARAYAREMEHYAALLPGRTVQSVYFGGGTPSLMESSVVAGVIEAVSRLWTLAGDAEITLEANPTSAEVEKFKTLHAAGVNRLSLGVQSLSDDALGFLGRRHSVLEAKRALDMAASLFPRFSFDLIYSRAGQTRKAWEAELREALALGARHMSLYQLTIERGSQFFKRADRQTLTADEDEAAEMFETTVAVMEDAGIPMYEISNFAAKGEESRHNLTYWHYDDYIGIGPGAHGRFAHDGVRQAMENHAAPDVWMQQVQREGQGSLVAEALDSATAQREALMMGMRLVAGIDKRRWHEKFSEALPVDRRALERLEREGLIVNNAETLRATRAGLMRLDYVLREVVV